MRPPFKEPRKVSIMYMAHSYGPAVVKLVACPTPSTGSETSPSHYFHKYCGDTLFSAYNSGGIVSGFRPIANIIGIGRLPQEQQDPNNDYMMISKPDQEVWNSAVDWTRYGSRLQAANFLRQIDPGAVSREHGVRHYHFQGDVEDVIPDESRLYDVAHHDLTVNDIDVDGWGKLYTGHPLTNFQATGFNTDGYLTFEVFNGVPGNQSTTVPLFSYLQYLEYTADTVNALGPDGYFISHGGGWRNYYRSVTDSSRKIDDNFHIIDVTYEFEMRWAGGTEIISSFFNVHILFTLNFVDVWGTNNPFDITSIDPACAILSDSTTVEPFRYRYQRPAEGIDVDDAYGLSQIYGTDLNFSLSVGSDFKSLSLFCSSVQKPEGGASNLMTYRLQGSTYNKRCFDRLLGGFDANLESLRPASFYSASKGLDDKLTVLESNNVENLAQLSGIIELLPDLGKIPSLVAKATRRDPSVIIDLIDYVTATVLKVRFAQVPTTKDALEIARTDIKRELSELLQTKYYTCYGLFQYVFSDEDNWVGPGDLVFSARSKVRLHVDISTFLGTLLSINGLGLLPTLERSWAVVPFSFVVDWFTNMSERLGAVDDQLKWLVFGCDWCVHSYRVVYFPTDDELVAYGLATSPGGAPFGLTVYKREFSLMLPRLSDSKFDFLTRQRPPNMVTVGSFLWQSLRK